MRACRQIHSIHIQELVVLKRDSAGNAARGSTPQVCGGCMEAAYRLKGLAKSYKMSTPTPETDNVYLVRAATE